MDVSVIIVNYNTCKLTLQCLQSIYEKTAGIDFEVIVVDNASSDDSVFFIRHQYPQVRVIESIENLGFGRANNLGAKHAKAKYLFLLNSDTILLNNALRSFFIVAESFDKDAAYGTYLMNEHHKWIHSYGNFPVIKNILLNAMYSYVRRIICYKPSTTMLIDKDKMKVDYITGADLFLKKELFVNIGGFDENIFLYFEETDLQKRMFDKGLFSYIIYGPQIVHLVGGSKDSGELSFSDRCYMKSQHYYLKKHNNRVYYYLYRLFFFILRFPIILLPRYSVKYKIDFIKLLLISA